MKKNRTIALAQVRELLRRPGQGRIVDRSGWGVFQFANGDQIYIFDEVAQPIAYAKLTGLAQKKRNNGAFVAISNEFV